MLKAILCAGSGGQGILTAGRLLIHAAVMEKAVVTWFPSYGSEMRGGTAKCEIKISDEPIANPFSNEFDILLAMNKLSFDKYSDQVKQGGFIFLNKSNISRRQEVSQDTVNVVEVPANDIAKKIDNAKSANLIMLGVLIKISSLFEIENFRQGMCHYFEKKGKGKFNPSNEKALMAGYELDL
jgi:2-oxoglutarate ferredoxin oxidoreductase subunit gamma